ncbi:MAG: cell division protein FtsZ [Thermanaerothrix sp.]|nr:cell division protein FtsZ [Thermanaerothrix sp.]
MTYPLFGIVPPDGGVTGPQGGDRLQGRAPKEVIKVIGVGGGGGNALSYMIKSGLSGVVSVAANTDVRALEGVDSDVKVILGRQLTKGLGAGARPELGRQAAVESKDEIRRVLEGADMVYFAAGMGGGTGTGALPVMAAMAREMGILTVAVVTKPFTFEGSRRMSNALRGIEELAPVVDSLIVIPNDRLIDLSDARMTIEESFAIANDVLRQAVQGVTDLIVNPGLVNVDFADVKAVMSRSGRAVMGIGSAQGEGRALEALRKAMESPLMEVRLKDASGGLINVTAGPDIGIHELNDAAEAFQGYLGEDALFFWGYRQDDNLRGTVKVVVIAAGFEAQGDSHLAAPGAVRPKGALREEHLRHRPREAHDRSPQDLSVGSLFEGSASHLDTPSILRRRSNKEPLE